MLCTSCVDDVNSVYKGAGGAGISESKANMAAMGAGFKTIGSAVLQSMGDSLYKTFTGQDKKRDTMDGKTLSFGQEFKDEGGHMRKADLGDMQRQAGVKGDAIGNDTVAKLKEQYDKHLPPDDQDAFIPKKK